MIDLDILSDQKVIQILRVIFSQTEPVTGHGISKKLTMSSNTATKYLEQLAANGVLKKEVIGKAYSYRLKDGYMAKELLGPLFQKEAMVGRIIEEKLKMYLGPELSALIIYGGPVEQRQNPTFANIDLNPYTVCCVVDAETDVLQAKLEDLDKWLQNQFNITLDATVVTHSELNDRQDLPLYQKIEQSGINLLES